MIIPVTTLDAIAHVADLADRIWREHYTPIIGAAQVDYMLSRFQSADAVAAQIRDERYRYYLLQESGEAIGYMAVQQRGSVLFVSKLYLLCSWRGRGYGREAVAFLASQAREHGCDRLELTVNKHNADSIAAYERLGFERCEAIVQEIGGGFVMDDYVMRRKL